MGSTFLDGFSAVLPPSQKEKLYSLMTEGQSTASTEQDLEALVIDLLNKIGNHEPTMALRLQEERTDSESYNQTLREILADLTSLYNESELINRTLMNNHKLNVSVLDSISKDIERLERKISSLNLIADNTDGYTSASIDDFGDESKTEKQADQNSYLFTDKDGSIFSSELVANINKNSSVLELGTSSINFDRIRANGNPVAKIEILEQTGQSFKTENNRYSIDKAIDSELGSFWGEVILTDEPLQVPIDGINKGAICKFRITFPTATSISEFLFTPYTEYPLEIISIAYSASDDGVTNGYIWNYNPLEPVMIDDIYRLSFQAVLAKSVTVTIRQAHATKHTYLISKDQLENKELWSKVNSVETSKTLDTPWGKDPNMINPAVSQDLIDHMDETWKIYMDNIANVPELLKNILDMSPIVFSNPGTFFWGFTDPRKTIRPERVQVDKFEYVYGAYDIQLNGKEYHNKGIYVSKPYKFDGNVQQVVIDVKESHPEIIYKGTVLKKYNYLNGELVQTDDPVRRTSIEYYISSKEDPGPENWIPILPLGQDRVNQEVLIFNNMELPRAKTRFRVDTTKPFALFKDEKPLIYNVNWKFVLNDDGSPSDQFIAIDHREWDQGSFYTIDYYPLGEPWIVDFSEHETEIVNTSEYFIGTDKNCTIKLEKYPYVNRARLLNDRSYNPVRVTLNPSDIIEVSQRLFGSQNLTMSSFKINGKKGAITSPIFSVMPYADTTSASDAQLMNITSYSEGLMTNLKSYNPKDTTPTFEYLHEGNKLYFTETFRHDGPIENYEASHGNAIIKVDYSYIVSGIRVKIILRRTNNLDTSVSPSVDSYTIKCKSLI